MPFVHVLVMTKVNDFDAFLLIKKQLNCDKRLFDPDISSSLPELN